MHVDQVEKYLFEHLPFHHRFCYYVILRRWIIFCIFSLCYSLWKYSKNQT